MNPAYRASPLLLLLLTLTLATAPAAAQQAAAKLKFKSKGAAETPAAAATLVGAAAPFAATITAAGLRADLTELASDAYQGRETGMLGQERAAQYLIRQFQALGLRGPVAEDAAGGGYRQTYALVSTVPTGPGRLRVGAATFAGGRDFLRFGSSSFGAGEVEVAAPLFRGYGLGEARYDDYAGRPDVRGRDVVVLYGEPHDARGRRLLSGAKPSAAELERADWNGLFRKAALARDHGARSLTVLTPAPGQDFAGMAQAMAPALAEPTVALAAPVPQPTEAAMLEMGPPAGISTLLTSGPLGLALLGTSVSGLLRYEKACYAGARPAPSPFEVVPFTVDFPERRQELSAANVLGLVEGTDKAEETVVVSAHYDHVGVQHDTIYNGADDDGSGTSAVLALARAFAQARAAGQGPRRSVLFLLNSGEEKGLLGSEHYAGHPVRPLATTVADLNIDMVGRTDPAHEQQPGGYLYLIGDNRLSAELRQVSEAANAASTRLKLDYKYNDPQDEEMLYYRSDHYNFARHGIPIIFYTSGLHADYHKATDDTEKIEFDKLAERARLVFVTAWELANREARLREDKPRP